jgi:hypothetical protein
MKKKRKKNQQARLRGKKLQQVSQATCQDVRSCHLESHYSHKCNLIAFS